MFLLNIYYLSIYYLSIYYVYYLFIDYDVYLVYCLVLVFGVQSVREEWNFERDFGVRIWSDRFA